MQLSFTKMEGAGNDYIYVDAIRQQFPLDRAAELGVDLYLGKPYQEEELMKHLREMTGVAATH